MFDDMIADIISNKNLHPAVSRLFFRSSKLNVCFAFHHTLKPNDVRLNTTNFFLVKSPD